MTDTPRTDAAILHAQIDLGRVERVVHHDFARQLERELAEARRVGGSAIVDNTRLIEELATVEKRYRTIREGVEKLANQLSGFERLDGDKIANELRALLK